MVFEGMNYVLVIIVFIGIELDLFEVKCMGIVDYEVWGCFWNLEMFKFILGEMLIIEMGQNGVCVVFEIYVSILDMLVDSDFDLLLGILNG